MKVISLEQVDLTPVTLEGAEGVGMRVLLAREDGAPGFTLRLFELKPRGHTMQHAHAHEHEIIVQQGEGTLWTPAREFVLAPGVVALVGPQEEHQFRAGAGGLSFFCIVPHAGH